MEKIAFAAGCYWGTERYFKKEFGPLLSNGMVGYLGGTVPNPTYEDVCAGETGHTEVFTFEYDSTQLPFPKLLEYFFRMHNSTTLNRQGEDEGIQYRSAIFCFSDEQLAVAEEFIRQVNEGENDEFKQKLERAFGTGSRITTVVLPAGPFYPAPADHQAYLDRNPDGYCIHRSYF